MRRLFLLASALILSCATPGAATKEPPARPIAGTVTAGGNPTSSAQVTVLKHLPALGAEPPCACENHQEHPLASCPAPESTEKLATLARTEPSGSPVTAVTSGPDGAFSTPPLPDGLYDLRAEVPGAQGWATRIAAGAEEVAVPLRPLAKVLGQVRGPDGAPASGAEVVVSAREVRDVQGVVTDDGGAFELPGIPLGAQQVVASHHAHVPARAQPTPAVAPDGTLGFLPLGLQLRPRVTLRGTVLKGGVPVEGAEVLAHSDCRTYRTRSNASGRFELADLPGRDYPVSAVLGFEGAQHPTSLAAPGPLTLELQPGGVLAGRVKNARGPLAGAEVVAIPRQPRGAEEIRRVYTGKDGSFELGPVPRGKWQLEVAAAGHLSRRAAEIRIAEGVRTPLEMELAPATIIAGFVVNDTADGLADAEVEAIRSDVESAECTGCRLTVRTEADGAFQLYPLAVGEYRLRVTHDRYLHEELAKVQPTDQLRVALRPGASLFGTIHDPAQRAAISARVSLLSADGTLARPVRAADPNGTFRLEGLAAGQYTVAVESGDPFPRRAETAVTIEPGGSASIDVTLPTGSSIAGRVVDEAEKPIAGATVYVVAEGGNGMAVATSAADGSFEVKRAWSGTYRVSATRDGHLAEPRSAATAEAGGRKVTLTLPRLPAVKGRVRVPAGRAAVETIWVSGRREAVDSRGLFRATLSRPGQQVVAIEAEGLSAAVMSVTAAAGREVDLGDMTLVAGRAIEGQVLDPDGVPVQRASVLAVDPRGKDALRDRLHGALDDRPPLAPVLTDTAGRFQVQHAPTGEVLLLVQHPLYVPGEVAVPAGQRSATVTLRKGSVVLGKVLDATGDPVRGAVTLVPADPQGTVLSRTVNDTGRFGFGGLSPGRYTVAASALPGVDGSFMVFDPGTAELREQETVQLDLRPRESGTMVTVQLRLPGSLGPLSARLLPAEALDAPVDSLYRRLFLAMPAESSLSRGPTFRHAPAGPQTLVLMRELGRGQIGLDRRRIDVPASGELSVVVKALSLETVLLDEGG